MHRWFWLSLPAVAVLSFGLGTRFAPRPTPPSPPGDNQPSTRGQPQQDANAGISAGEAGATSGLAALPPGVPLESWSRDELQIHYRELAAANAAQARELARLRRTAQQSAPASAHTTAPQAEQNLLARRFYPLAQDELESLAKNCSVRVDQPPVLESTPRKLGENDEFADARPEERAAMNRVLATLHREFRDDLRSLYEEAVGHAPNTELAPRTLLSEIGDKSTAGERGRVLKAVASERAKQAQAPAPKAASPYERAQRAYFQLGDEFQQRLARELGQERAHQLRAQSGGWPWQRSVFSGCE